MKPDVYTLGGQTFQSEALYVAFVNLLQETAMLPDISMSFNLDLRVSDNLIFLLSTFNAMTFNGFGIFSIVPTMFCLQLKKNPDNAAEHGQTSITRCKKSWYRVFLFACNEMVT